jgi:hypothetical protein
MDSTCQRTLRCAVSGPCDKRGNESGETSWLARRIGQLPEAGNPHPTPWIHSDALIARDGLSITPREVEAWRDRSIDLTFLT